MTEKWRYCCPHCGCHTFHARTGKSMGPAARNPEDRYRCGDGCGRTFDQPRDKKASATPEVPADD